MHNAECEFRIILHFAFSILHFHEVNIMKRIFLIVLDSFGIGAMPDSEAFGDVGVNTLRSCATSAKLNIPTMISAGLANIDGVDCLP